VTVVSEDRNASRNADRIGELASSAADFGLEVAVEFMAYSGIKSLVEVNKVLDLCRDPRARILLDALHWARSNGTVQDIEQTDASRIPFVQLCDAPLSPPSPQEGGLVYEARQQRLLPGEGSLPLGELLAALDADVPLSVETPVTQWHGHMSDLMIAQRALDATQRLLESLPAASVVP
jgi:sugar phosphate isomerase/epimerase